MGVDTNQVPSVVPLNTMEPVPIGGPSLSCTYQGCKEPFVSSTDDGLRRWCRQHEERERISRVSGLSREGVKISPVLKKILPSPVARADAKREPFVRERFSLSPASRDRVRAASWSFGFGAFSEIVYHDNYARRKPGGGIETWPETILRVVEGVLSIRKDWYARSRLKWDDGWWQEIGEEMALAFLHLRCGPPGRGYFAMGTDYVYERGSAALFNCCAVKVHPETLDRDFGWAMDMLMNGGGVGFECVPRVYKLQEPSGEPGLYVVPDTREGWVESVEILLRSYMGASGRVEFDTSEIRQLGAPIKSFGGVCSGPEPLRRLHEGIRETCSRYARGEISSTRFVADLANRIGCCVVAGNVRRSAEILIGSPEDREFLDLKDYEKYPEREEIGWISNNSLRLSESKHFELIPEIAARIRRNGEPGILNQIAMQRFGRFGRNIPDSADLWNPCQPAGATVLTRNGIGTIGEIQEGDEIWSGCRWTKVLRKVATGVKPVFAFRTRAGVFVGTAEHRVIQTGERIEAQHAEGIDVASVADAWGVFSREGFDARDVMDGLVLGDGSVHKASNGLVYLIVGKNDHDYFESEIRHLFTEERPGLHQGAWEVQTTIRAEELPKTYERRVPDRFARGVIWRMRGFLRGLYSANGSVVRNRVTLKASSLSVIEIVQQMLSALGIQSYYTINRSHDVEFSNGLYTCRQSYDLNITSDRARFRDLIGFLQGYKMEKLESVIQFIAENRSASKRKTTFEIAEVEFLGEEPVYDITVEAGEHTYWTGGLLVSNCTEIPLEDKEVCNLSEVYPSRCDTSKEIIRAVELACLFSSSVALLPTHRPETNAVLARNRRIGVGMSGIADWESRATVAEMTRTLRRSYEAVVAENRRLGEEAGIPSSIRCTTVKPSGTVSLLSGVAPGGHYALGRVYIRRKRVAETSPLRPLLDAAGYPCEPDLDSANTLVYEFPMKQEGVRTQRDAGVYEQALQLCMLQREWADNSVSFTLEFDPTTEGPALGNLLAQIAPMVKAVSAFPRASGAYRLPPYEEISEREYRLRMKMLHPIDWSKFRGEGSGEADKYCNKDGCAVKGKTP